MERVAGSRETQSIDITLKMPDGVHRYDYSIRPIKNNSGDVISLAPEVNETPHVLSDREREVLSWTAQGKTAGEIGSILSISARTIEWHIQKATEDQRRERRSRHRAGDQGWRNRVALAHQS